MSLQVLEPCEGKLSRTVLRGKEAVKSLTYPSTALINVATGINENLPNKSSYKRRYDSNGNLISLPYITGAMIIDRSLSDPDYLMEMYDSEVSINIVMSR